MSKPREKSPKKKKNPVIRKLRIEFITVMMTIVVVFLAVIFGVQYFSERNSFRTESRESLENALNSLPLLMMESGDFSEIDDFFDFKGGLRPPNAFGDGDSVPEGFDPGRRRGNLNDFRDRESRTAVLLAVVNTESEVTILQNNIFFIDASDVSDLIRTATADAGESGEISDHSMKYMKKTLKTGSTAVAFVDISSEKSILKSDLIRSLWISAAVIVTMFLLSLILSRLTIRPVERAWEDQRRFVADASHELKTPLTVIMSNTDMVERSLKGILEEGEPAQEDQRIISERKLERNLRRMENVREESLRMKELIGELLEIARGDTGQNIASFQDLSLSEITNDALLTWESVFYEKGKRLSGSVEEDIHIQGDSTTLRRLIEILIDNALKYSSDHSETLVTLKKEKSGSHRTAHLTVTNEGTPLTQEELSHLFDRFYRADSSREKISGYGLGLSIAVSITEAHRGRIWAEAETKGNSFHVTLPL